MATHQEILGITDEQLAQIMVNSYPMRFGQGFWEFFDREVAPTVPARPVVADLGCGPGLLLRDLAQRFPGATLYGYDIAPTMVGLAKGQEFPSAATTTLEVRDLLKEPIPPADGSVHLVVMAMVLHVLDNPQALLAEVRRVLAPGGTLVVHDWVRVPLRDYLSSGLGGGPSSDPDATRHIAKRLFVIHNKYTEEDWRWVFEDSGFLVRSLAYLRPSVAVFHAEPTA